MSSRKKIHIEDTFSLDDILNSEEGYASIYLREPIKKSTNGMSIKYIGNIDGKLGVATKRLRRVDLTNAIQDPFQNVRPRRRRSDRLGRAGIAAF